MAYSYSGVDKQKYTFSDGSTGTGATKARVQGSVSSTDTTTTVTVSGAVQSVSPWNLQGYGVKATIGHYGHGSTSAASTYHTGILDYQKWVADGSKAFKFPRAANAYTVTVYCKYAGATVSGHSACKGGGTVTQKVTVPALPVYAPSAPTNCKHTRASDTVNNVTWTNNTSATKPYTEMWIARSVDNGPRTYIAKISPSSTKYQDRDASPNHSYQYLIYAKNAKGKAESNWSAETFNTPTAPTKVTAARTTATGVKLTIENPALTATAATIERMASGGSWQKVATVQASPLLSFDDNPGGGTFYYRVRNERGSLVSAWSPTSNAVVTIMPPAAPTIIEPSSGTVISTAAESFTVSWKHNSRDGSPQSAAIVEYSTNNGMSWVTREVVGDAQSIIIDNNFETNTEIGIRVKTKGADVSYGEYSFVTTVSVLSAPTVYFLEPTSGFIVNNMPIRIKLSYSDVSGALYSAQIKILDDAGRVVFTQDLGTKTSAVIEVENYLPQNNKSYVIEAYVRSTSTLSAKSQTNFEVAFIPPVEGELSITGDDETGYAYIEVALTDPIDSQTAKAVYANVYRVYDGERVLLGEKLESGASIIDVLAPLNVQCQYEIVTFAESGVYVSSVFTHMVETKYCFWYFEKEMARCRWGVQTSIKLSKPDKKRVYYAGRKDPVSYDSNTRQDKRSCSGVIMNRDEKRTFEALLFCGHAWYKSYDGDVLFVDIDDVSLSPDLYSRVHYGEVDVSMVRTDPSGVDVVQVIEVQDGRFL